MKDLAIQGSELKALGIRGRDIGLTMEYLLKLIWEKPQQNTKKELLHLANELKNASRQV